MSIDTDQWIAALLVYAVYPSTHNVRVVVRSHKGLGCGAVQYIDVLEIFKKLTTRPDWPHNFSSLQRCLRVIVAYVLWGTDFTPTLYSLTALNMFQTYYEALADASNHCFVRPLGSALDDDNSAGLTLNAEECVKFVGLCYFIKSRKLFTNVRPGYQVEGPSQAERQPYETRRWIDAL